MVGVLALTQVFALTARANATARHVTIASVLAAQKIEELRSTAWSIPAQGVDSVAEFTRQWSVAPLAADPAHTAVIQVRVTPGAVRLVTLRTADDP